MAFLSPETWEAMRTEEARASLGFVEILGAIAGPLVGPLLTQLPSVKKEKKREQEAQERAMRERREHEIKLARMAQERQARLLKIGATIGAVGLGGLLLWKIVRALARPRRPKAVAA